jgi:tetratricopeptide (TPR) repeat protein
MQRRLWLFWSPLLVIGLIACATGKKEEQLQKQREGEAYRKVGEAYMQEGNYTAALNQLLKAKQFYEADHILHNDLGLVYMAKNNLTKAVQHFKRAVELNPEYAVAKNNLGYAYLAQENYDAAIEVFESISGELLYGTPHYPLTNLGLAYYRKKEYETALKYYQQALDLSPNFGNALRGQGQTYIAMERYEEAIAVFQKASKVSAGLALAETYMGLGDAYRGFGDSSSAQQAYQKVIELSPDSRLSQQADVALKTLRSQ